ncbi:AAA domain-containing protein, partial [Thamnocephalis sphaerospora]
RSVRRMLVEQADIVCATLSASGHDILASLRVRFTTVIVDEASQSVELSTLIPMQYGCRRCILVGDQNQLPPTVLSTHAADFNYARSLFERAQKVQPDAVDLLTIQYRMHPQISKFPSRLFYQGRIKDGPNMDERTAAPWHEHTVFGPFVFYNALRGQEQSVGGRSYANSREAEVAILIVEELCRRHPNIQASSIFANRIGIITPYKDQLRELRRRFMRRFGSSICDAIDFNTIDGFQGQEKDIIIFSCVRASAQQRVGFLADLRRMNVALTRAKSSLFVIGNANTLSANPHWRKLVDEATGRRCMHDV